MAMEKLRVKLGFDAKLVVDKEGNNSGLYLFWKADISISLLSYSRFHIDTVMGSFNGKIWRLTGFYGHPNLSQRFHGWTLLRRLASVSSIQWLVRGYFKKILCLSEKLGGVPRQDSLMDNF
ncbi:hypothetical protein Ddye_013313 [Dipteronia dyeriana]|uniref:Uncharacterized protein n=1 Tax=Dipteronia dyeriana TaxID=168575 RepID=A0AAE0CJH1_9ROSI|nr:hypothetical protein Ddye_013313 [Dipteronia dyeriana]